MKQLHQLILKSFVGPFFATLFIAVFVLVMQFLWLYIDDLIGKGLELYIIARLFFYASLSTVPMAMPIAVLIASIMTFGNLGEHFELTAIKSSGISLRRIMTPLMILSFFVSIAAFLFTEKIIPYSNLKMYTLLFDVQHQNPALDIRESQFNNDIDGFSIRIGDKSNKTKMMYDFMIYDHSKNKGNNIVIVADSGMIRVTDDLKFMLITLYSGCQYEEQNEEEKDMEKKTYPHVRNIFTEQTLSLKLKGFGFEESDDAIFKKNYQMLDMTSLKKAIDSLSNKYERKFEFTKKTLIGNKYLKNEIKIRNKSDSALYISADSVRRNLSASNLPIFIDVDSAYEAENIFIQSKILELSSEYAQKVKEQIRSSKSELGGKHEWIAKHKIVWHKKLTYAVACLIFFFIGAPLGAIIKKGGFGLPIIISIVFFLIYYIISMAAEKMVREGVLDAIFGMWFSSLLIFPVGIFLTWKATTDATILNFDAYKDVLTKFFIKFKRKKLNNEQLIIDN